MRGADASEEGPARGSPNREIGAKRRGVAVTGTAGAGACEIPHCDAKDWTLETCIDGTARGCRLVEPLSAARVLQHPEASHARNVAGSAVLGDGWRPPRDGLTSPEGKGRIDSTASGGARTIHEWTALAFRAAACNLEL